MILLNTELMAREYVLRPIRGGALSFVCTTVLLVICRPIVNSRPSGNPSGSPRGNRSDFSHEPRSRKCP